MSYIMEDIGPNINEKIDDIREKKKKKKELKNKGFVCMTCRSANNVYCPDPTASNSHIYILKKSLWKQILEGVIIFCIVVIFLTILSFASYIITL